MKFSLLYKLLYGMALANSLPGSDRQSLDSGSEITIMEECQVKYTKQLLAILLVFSLIALGGCAKRDGNDKGPLEEIESHTEALVNDSKGIVEEPFPEVSQESRPSTPVESRTQEAISRPEEEISAATAMGGDHTAIAQLDGETKGWGSGGGGVDDKGRPMGPVTFQDKFGDYDAYFIVPDSEDIYLTFDEGYEYGFTPAILDTLQEKNVQAVFFITGHFARTEPELVQRMVDEGHIVGNHSDSHKIYPDLPLAEAEKDLMALHDYVLETFEYEMSLFRFPEGKYSEQSLALIQSLGYQSVFWSFAYKDYDINNQPLSIDALDRITKNSHPGAIYLLHAVSRTNSEVLPEVIDLLRAEGYQLAPLKL